MDMQGSAHTGAGEDGTEEYCITIAASLARSLIGDGHAVGMVVQGDEYYRFLPRRDQDHLWSMMGALATVRARGATPISTVMSQEGARLGPETVAIIVGAVVGTEHDPPVPVSHQPRCPGRAHTPRHTQLCQDRVGPSRAARAAAGAVRLRGTEGRRPLPDPGQRSGPHCDLLTSAL